MIKPIKIKLKSDEREKLESIVRKSKSAQRDVIRAKIILEAAGGKGNRAMARELGIALNTVLQWRRRFSQKGVEGLKDNPRSGRPLDFSP